MPIQPIPSYLTPGVYVTQSGTSLGTTSTTDLNIAIVADATIPGNGTDYFYGVTLSGTTVGALSNPLVVTSGAVVTFISGTSTSGITATSGVNYKFITPSGSNATYLSTSGITGSPVSGTVTVNYTYNFGGAGVYSSYTQLQNNFGVPVSGTSVVSPVSLAAFLAFNNGANTVTVIPVARLSTYSGNGVGTSASVSDWQRTFVAASGGSSDPTYLSTWTGIDVVVPLYGFVDGGNQLITSATSNVAGSIKSYLDTVSGYGTFQRAFIGIDGTGNQITASGLQTLVNNLNTTRMSLVAPTVLTFNPGINPANGSSNTTINIPGYYLAAAVAGVFVGQPDVSTPITNKIVSGFVDIPNQVSPLDAQSNYLAYGITTIRKKRDGNLWVLQGLTTNITNWLTQEISINAIGDRLATLVKYALEDSALIGQPMTKNTIGAALGNIQAVLTESVNDGLIQSYTNLQYTINASTPTTINVTFQYAPTYPINYINVALSLNSQTGQINYGNTPSNTTVY